MTSINVASSAIPERAKGTFGSFLNEELLNSSVVHQCGATTLLVMLPGALMTPQHMLQAGLFDILRQRGLALDLIAPNLHALEGCNRAALQSLAIDILMPARAHYTQIWLGGISRGGQLALSCLAEQPSLINGLCLLAPYAGSRLTTNVIRRAGGLAAWQPTPEQLRDPEFRLWQWLKHPNMPGPVFMGFGEQDRFADGMAILAHHLPMATHFQVSGGHDWSVWLQLWRHFIDLGFFDRLP